MTSEDPRADTTELMCPWCQGPFGIMLSMAGDTVHCPHCDGEVTIPSRADLLFMTAPPAEPPPVIPGAGGSPAPPIVGNPSGTSAAAPLVTGSSGDPQTSPPAPVQSLPLPLKLASPAAATSPDISPPKIVHTQSREGEAVAFRARGKVIRTERGDIELRERSRGERSLRRNVRNLVLIVLCLVILLGLPAWLLSRKPKPPPSPSNSDSPIEPSAPASS